MLINAGPAASFPIDKSLCESCHWWGSCSPGCSSDWRDGAAASHIWSNAEATEEHFDHQRIFKIKWIKEFSLPCKFWNALLFSIMSPELLLNGNSYNVIHCSYYYHLKKKVLSTIWTHHHLNQSCFLIFFYYLFTTSKHDTLRMKQKQNHSLPPH